LAVEIHDKQINILLSKGRRQQEEIHKQNARSLNEKIIHYVDIGTALIKSRNEGLNPFDTIESVMSWNKVVESVEDAQKLTRPQSYDYLDLLPNKYHHLRKYPGIGQTSEIFLNRRIHEFFGKGYIRNTCCK